MSRRYHLRRVRLSSAVAGHTVPAGEETSDLRMASVVCYAGPPNYTLQPTFGAAAATAIASATSSPNAPELLR